MPRLSSSPLVKLNSRFPFVAAVMISNSPRRPARLKRRLYRHHPDDLRPSRLAAAAAHGGPVIEDAVPLVLVLSHGGTVTAIAPGRDAALIGLLPRAVDDVESYDVREGETVAGAVLGWNFGDAATAQRGSWWAAVPQRCGIAPGDLRVVVLEARPTHRQRRHYRILDAATGWIEEGHVNVRGMVTRQPWLDDEAPAIAVEPVEPVGTTRPVTEPAAAHERHDRGRRA